jgi:hypothetical protein
LLGAGVAGAAAGAIGFGLAFALLRRIPGKPGWSVADFTLSTMTAGQEPQSELLLTNADRLPSLDLGSAAQAIADELLLDDPLAPVKAESRVVQLFGPQPLPTAGELQTSIDRHLECRQAPDASAALSAALAELRRSLR